MDINSAFCRKRPLKAVLVKRARGEIQYLLEDRAIAGVCGVTEVVWCLQKESEEEPSGKSDGPFESITCEGGV